MRRVEGRRSVPLARYAAAAALALTMAGVVTWQEVSKSQSLRVSEAVVATAALENDGTSVTSDPWQSEELKDYQPVVAWESWVETKTKNGDHS